MAHIPIWPGSSSFALTLNPTPFGFYDEDDDFRDDADKVTNWCASRLGYPLIDSNLNTPDAIKKVLDLLEAQYTNEDYYRSIIATLVPYLTLNQILNTCNGLHPTT